LWLLAINAIKLIRLRSERLVIWKSLRITEWVNQPRELKGHQDCSRLSLEFSIRGDHQPVKLNQWVYLVAYFVEIIYRISSSC
jgi:hypothetical protein